MNDLHLHLVLNHLPVVVLLVVDLGAVALLSRTATLGGEIAHPEIRGEVLVPGAARSTT